MTVRSGARLLLVALTAALAALAVPCADATPQDGGQPAPPAPAGPPRECKVEVLAKGEGRPLRRDDKVLAHLSVKLADSGRTLMDTHLEREPQVLVVGSGNLVAALDESLAKMRMGDHWRIEAPYELAWGEAGYPKMIPAKSDVVLDVELVGFLELTTRVVKEGTGATPVAGEYVLLHYTGKLADGTEFDDTRKGDEPLLMIMGQGKVIQGWEFALRGMKAGERTEVKIPWQLAYGARGLPPAVPPRADVVYDLERLPLPEIKAEIVKEGSGPMCVPGREILVHYVGTLEDGKVFDESRSKNRPLKVNLGNHRVIAGLELTIARMRVGDRWKLTVPWQLAYGTEGHGDIKGRANLTFDLEIMSMK